MAYRRPYNRPYYRTSAVTSVSTGGCTERQQAFILTLVGQIEAGEATASSELLAATAETLAGLTELPALLSDDFMAVGRDATSRVIDTLKALAATFKAVAPADPALVGVGAHTRAMKTRFGGKCCKCGARTTPDVDWAIQTASGWAAWCLTCAATDPADAARAAQERAAAEAAAREAENNEAELVKKFFTVLFGAVGHPTDPVPVRKIVRFAVPSLSGNNDLSFYVARSRPGGRFTLARTIGGHGDSPVSAAETRQVMGDLCLRGAQYIHLAVKKYGQELGRCGHCGKHLTQETSRKAGIGPVCGKYFK